MAESKRLFVGGLVNGISKEDVKLRFSKFGVVTDVDIHTKKEGTTPGDTKTFAYVNISISETNLNKCMQVYHKSKWKGKELTIQVAKESFLERLKRERLQQEEEKAKSLQTGKPLDHEEVKNTIIKSKPEGAPVDNKRNWVVGKDGHILPVMFIRDKDKKKVRKIDPTTYSSSNKTIEGEDEPTDTPVEKLTWVLDERPQKKIKFSPVKEVDFGKKEKPVTNGSVNSSKLASKKQPVAKGRLGSGTIDFYSDSDTEGRFPSGKFGVRTYRSSESSDEDEKSSMTFCQKKAGKMAKIRTKKRKSDKLRSNLSSEDSDSDGESKSASQIYSVEGTDLASLPGWLQSDSDSEENIEASTKAASRNARKNETKQVSKLHSKRLEIDGDKADAGLEEKSVPKSKSKTSVRSPASETPKLKPGYEAKSNYQERVLDEYDSGLHKGRGAKRRFEREEEDMDIFDIIAAGKVNTLFKNEKSAIDGNKKEGKTKRTEIDKNFNKVTIANETSSIAKDNKKILDDKTSDGKLNKKSKNAGGNLTKAERHAASNQQRLETLKERQKEAKSHKLLVQKALASVDSQTVNKKITFDSDDEDEPVIPASLSTSSTKQMDIVKDNAMKQNKLPKLFDSESSSDEGGSDSETDHFDVRPEFEGKSGKKLLKLQSRFGNDTRFKLDARFAESDSDSDVNEGREKTEDLDEQETVESEKARALEILRGVVGNVALKKKKEAKGEFKDISTLHYDPMKQDHQKFEIPEEKKPKKSSKKEGKLGEAQSAEADTATSIMPEVSSEKFFEVTAPLKEVFGKSKDDKVLEQTSNDDGGKGFSILAMFGQSHDEVEEREQAPYQVSEPTRSLFPAMGALGYGDSSDDEDEKRDVEDKKKFKETAMEDMFKPKQELFFFTEDDPRIKEAIEFFHCTEDEETIREKWKEQRPFLVETYTTRRKRALRQKRSTSHGMMASKRGRKR